MFNNLFLMHIKHEQEKEDIIQIILNLIQNGEQFGSIQLNDYFSDKDIDYIKKEVLRRIK